ncbi:hypothetical protein C8J56DRAFT_480469 [Mycena floridula]|nr:hypothetical protein C8J56DRAFT_480469 [Mycena floridula]
MPPRASLTTIPLFVFPDLYPTPYKTLLALHIISLVGIPLVLLTALLARGVKRHPIWYNFMACWIINSIFWVMLAIAGQLDTGFQVPHTLCLAQASIIHAMPVLISASTLSFALHTWLTLRSILHNQSLELRPRTTIMLLCLPYAITLANVIAVLIYVFRHPTALFRINHLQCTILVLPLQNTAFGVSLGLICGAFVLQVSIGYYVFHSYPAIVNSQEYGRIIRLLLFTTLVLFSIASEIYGIADQLHHLLSVVWLSVVAAILPFSALLLFGTQADMLHAWMFWIPTKVD